MEALIPKEQEYRYRLSDQDGEFDEPSPFKSRHKPDSDFRLQMIAQDAAWIYFWECQGYERTWPLEFRIYSGDELLGTFEIQMEAVPDFTAKQIDK